MDAPEVSTAASLEAVSQVFELPVPQGKGGAPFRMRLWAPEYEAVLEFRKGLPPAGKAEADAEQKDAADQIEDELRGLRDLAGLVKGLVEAGARSEPPISFTVPGDSGSVYWGALHIRNRSFIVATWMRLAGLGPLPPRAEQIATFREVDRERGDSGAAGNGAVPVAEVAAPSPGD